MIDTICIVFKDKIEEYVEGNLRSSFSATIEEHIKHCENCKRLYENELRVTKMLKKAFYVNNVNFISCRTEVIRNINPELYKKGLISNLKS